MREKTSYERVLGTVGSPNMIPMLGWTVESFPRPIYIHRRLSSVLGQDGIKFHPFYI